MTSSTGHRMILLLALCGMVTAATPTARAAATSLDCERAISKGYAKFLRADSKAQRKCWDAVVNNASASSCPDARTTAQITQAASKLRAAVSQKCGGADRNCGLGGDDVPLAAIGWNVGVCPNFEGGSCSNAIDDCSDVSACLVCVGSAAVDQAMALYYADADLAATNPEVIGCQRAIGKAGEKFFATKVKALQRCEDRVLVGVSAGPCPDGAAAAKIAKAEQKKIASICRSCGGADRQCGSADDLAPATIGFTPSCPDVTVPGGPACAAAVSVLGNVVACVDCVTEFKADCVDAISVPRVKSYPSECDHNPAATPTVTATPTRTATPTGTVTALATPTTTRTATPSVTMPIPTSTRTATSSPTPTLPQPTPTPTLTVPLPTITLPTVTLPLPTLTLPLPTVTLTVPLPTLTIPLPTVTLPLPTVTVPVPTPTAACGNGVLDPGEVCELPDINCGGLLPLCVGCLLCSPL